ncbi:MAG: pentapeptide repeat-containing protein [Planctomycetaceae bacterium]|nr:pentapeptide repeat-containing protein [Planctomycetaceae bacterium]
MKKIHNVGVWLLILSLSAIIVLVIMDFSHLKDFSLLLKEEKYVAKTNNSDDNTSQLTNFGEFANKIAIPFFAGIGTILALGVIAWQLMHQNQQLKNHKDTADKTLRQTQFRDAIKFLGHKNQTVVLGGVYALNDLVRQHREEFSQTVFEMLCGFVRGETRKDSYKNKVADIMDRSRTPPENPPPSVSVNVIQTIFNRLFFNIDSSRLYPREPSKIQINFSDACLRGIYFKGSKSNELDWRLARLWKTDLQGVDLSDTDLQGADLWHADCRGTDLRGANLSGADVKGTLFNDLTKFDCTTRLRGVQASAHTPEVTIKNAIRENVNFETTLRQIEIQTHDSTITDKRMWKKHWLRKKMLEGTVKIMLEGKPENRIDEVFSIITPLIEAADCFDNETQSFCDDIKDEVLGKLATDIILATEQYITSRRLKPIALSKKAKLIKHIKGINRNFDRITHKDLKKLAKHLRIRLK